MLINGKDIKYYNCECLKFLHSNSNYSFNDDFNMNSKSKTSLIGVKENIRSLDALFLFKGDKNTVHKNVSNFIENIKSSIIESSSFYYKVILEGNSSLSVVTNNSFKLKLSLTLIDLFEVEKSITTNSSDTIIMNSNKACYANLELIANTNVIDCIVKINDTEIVIRNIKANEKVYIGSGKILAGGKSKIADVDLWEFPKLDREVNQVSINRKDVNLTVKYNERW